MTIRIERSNKGTATIDSISTPIENMTKIQLIDLTQQTEKLYLLFPATQSASGIDELYLVDYAARKLVRLN